MLFSIVGKIFWNFFCNFILLLVKLNKKLVVYYVPSKILWLIFSCWRALIRSYTQYSVSSVIFSFPSNVHRVIPHKERHKKYFTLTNMGKWIQFSFVYFNTFEDCCTTVLILVWPEKRSTDFLFGFKNKIKILRVLPILNFDIIRFTRTKFCLRSSFESKNWTNGFTMFPIHIQC